MGETQASDTPAGVSNVGRQTSEHPLETAADSVEAVLGHFKVIRSPLLQWVVVNLPSVLALLLLADWLIGRSIFAGDVFRLSGAVTIIIEMLIIRVLFDKVPEALRTIWERGLLAPSSDTQPPAAAFLSFVHRFEATLNSQLAWLVGIIFGVGGFIATYPIRYWIRAGSNPFPDPAQWISFYFGAGAILEIPVAILVGLLAWRCGAIALYITRLGQQFELKIQPRHPDQSGGLRPLGGLCLTNAFLILVPAFFLAGWVAAGTRAGLEVYGILWAGLFKRGLVMLSIAAAFLFFRPLYRTHQQMEKQRRAIRRELNELSNKIEEISLNLRTEADTLTPDEGTKRLEELKFLENVYQETSHVPTWPFDWKIILKFVAAETVPILSLIGVGTPLIKLVESLISLLSP